MPVSLFLPSDSSLQYFVSFSLYTVTEGYLLLYAFYLFSATGTTSVRVLLPTAKPSNRKHTKLARGPRLDDIFLLRFSGRTSL